jgi:hypothetical protein
MDRMELVPARLLAATEDLKKLRTAIRNDVVRPSRV